MPSTSSTLKVQFFYSFRCFQEGVTEYGVQPGLFKPAGSGGAPPAPAPAVAAAAPSAATPTSSGFYVGQRVEAKHGGKSKWYSATVMAVPEPGSFGNESYKICYDGGMWNNWMPATEPAVPASDIRPHAAANEQASSLPSSASSSFDHRCGQSPSPVLLPIASFSIPFNLHEGACLLPLV